MSSILEHLVLPDGEDLVVLDLKNDDELYRVRSAPVAFLTSDVLVTKEEHHLMRIHRWRQ